MNDPSLKESTETSSQNRETPKAGKEMYAWMPLACMAGVAIGILVVRLLLLALR